MARNESISPVIFIAPIWAAYAEPERAATMMAVSSGARSRSIARPTRSATSTPAPMGRKRDEAW